jgi:hypothetical protein
MNVIEPQPAPPTHRAPHGFDSGLLCLTGVFFFTIIDRKILRAALDAHSRIWILLALVEDIGAMFALLTICLLVWMRRERTENPPRLWALFLAFLWAFIQLAFMVKTMLSN